MAHSWIRQPFSLAIRSLDKCKGSPAIVSGPRTARGQLQAWSDRAGPIQSCPTHVFDPQSRGLVLLFRDREPWCVHNHLHGCLSIFPSPGTFSSLTPAPLVLRAPGNSHMSREARQYSWGPGLSMGIGSCDKGSWLWPQGQSNDHLPWAELGLDWLWGWVVLLKEGLGSCTQMGRKPWPPHKAQPQPMFPQAACFPSGSVCSFRHTLHIPSLPPLAQRGPHRTVRRGEAGPGGPESAREPETCNVTP